MTNHPNRNRIGTATFKVTRYGNEGGTMVWGCTPRNLPLSEMQAKRLADRLRRDEAVGVSMYSELGKYVVEAA